MKAQLAALLGSTAIALGVAECGLRAFHSQSDGFGMTRAAQRWEARHWGPENRFGFRDREYSEAELEGGRWYVALGDSFTAGHGIARREDRYAERVARGLGSEWSLAVMARNGWSTADELDALRGFPARPQRVTLQYYANDVQGAAATHGRSFDFEAQAPQGWRGALVARVDLANFAYWRVRRLGLRAQSERYWDFIAESFEDPEVWRSHAEELRAVAREADDAGASLIVLIFPNLFDVEQSRPFATRVAGLFAELAVPTLDLSDPLAGRDPRSLIVNANDAHANEALNAEVAEHLLRLMER